jgi:hypothetical protein
MANNASRSFSNERNDTKRTYYVATFKFGCVWVFEQLNTVVNTANSRDQSSLGSQAHCRIPLHSQFRVLPQLERAHDLIDYASLVCLTNTSLYVNSPTWV